MIRSCFYFLSFILKAPFFIARRNKISFNNKIAKNVFISNSVIGKYNYIGRNSVIRLTKIGNYCSIAAGVQIGGMEHPYWWGSTSPYLFDKIIDIDNQYTFIEDDVWIGANVIIRRGVKIGRGAVIGSSSLVLSDVKPYTIVAGTPAKYIKNRFHLSVEKQVASTSFWNKSIGEARFKLKRIKYKS